MMGFVMKKNDRNCGSEKFKIHYTPTCHISNSLKRLAVLIPFSFPFLLILRIGNNRCQSWDKTKESWNLNHNQFIITSIRSSPAGVFWGESVLKICSKFTGIWNRTSAWVFSCKFATYFRTPFYKNTYGGSIYLPSWWPTQGWLKTTSWGVSWISRCFLLFCHHLNLWFNSVPVIMLGFNNLPNYVAINTLIWIKNFHKAFAIYLK